MAQRLRASEMATWVGIRARSRVGVRVRVRVKVRVRVRGWAGVRGWARVRGWRATVKASQVRMLSARLALIFGGRANQWATPNLEAWKETSR